MKVQKESAMIRGFCQLKELRLCVFVKYLLSVPGFIITRYRFRKREISHSGKGQCPLCKFFPESVFDKQILSCNKLSQQVNKQRVSNVLKRQHEINVFKLKNVGRFLQLRRISEFCGLCCYVGKPDP